MSLIVDFFLFQCLFEVSLVQVIDVLVKSAYLQSVQELLLNRSFNLGCLQGRCLSILFSFLVLLVDSYKRLLGMVLRKLELSLSDDHLVNLGEPLLALMTLELSPELKILVDHLQSLLIVSGQLDLLPELAWKMRSLNSLHEKIALSLLLFDSCITAVCQWTTVSIAKTGKVVFVSTKLLGDRLGLEGTMAIVDNIPNNVVLDHGGLKLK